MSSKWLLSVVVVYILVCETKAECKEDITTPLKRHLVPDAIKHFRGNFTDVWSSRHVVQMLNSSYTEIWQNGSIINYVINKDGQGYSAVGNIRADDEGIIHIKVDGFDVPGFIFPVFASPKAIAYYSCYPYVEGAGVSVVAARRGCLFSDILEDVLEAQVVFRRLQEEFGIPINDGEDYDHG